MITKVVRGSKVRCYVRIILVVTKYKIHNILHSIRIGIRAAVLKLNPDAS